MGRFSWLLILLLGNAVSLRNSADAVSIFDPNVSKYKLPAAFYPENDRDAIPVRESLRMREVPNIDLADFKLPMEFYPENDRDAIPIYPRTRNLARSKDNPYGIPARNHVVDTYIQNPEQSPNIFRFARVFRQHDHPKQGNFKDDDVMKRQESEEESEEEPEEEPEPEQPQTTPKGHEQEYMGREVFLERLQKIFRDFKKTFKALVDNGKQ